MSDPSWLSDTFAALVLASAAYFLALAALAVATRRAAGLDVELSHLVMGVTMAGMFVAALGFGPPVAWEAIFGALTLWFVVRSLQALLRFGRHLPHTAVHALMSLAMVLMYKFPGSASMIPGNAARPAARLDPGLAALFAATLLASGIFALASSERGRSVYGSHSGSGATLVATTGGEGAGVPDGVVEGRDGPLVAVGLVDVAHVVMTVAMGYLLVLML